MSSEALAIRDEQHYLATIADVRDLATQITNVGDARDLADRARAAQVWAQRAKLGTNQVNLAAIARLWAERRAGELLPDVVQHGGDRRPEASSHHTTLHALGVTKDESSRWQQLAEIPPDTFEDAIAQASEEGLVSTSKVKRLAVHYSSATDDWSTPQALYDLLDQEFGFQLDVCATDDNAKCAFYFTADDDGLTKTWSGACFMNPPYGPVIGDWVRKAYESAEAGATVVCLVPARTDTGWWWQYARYGEVRFLRGRLKFGGATTGAPFPSAVVIFGRPATVEWWEAWPTG